MTVQIFFDLQNHTTFHSEEMLVNLVRGRECFVGLYILFLTLVLSRCRRGCKRRWTGSWLTGLPPWRIVPGLFKTTLRLPSRRWDIFGFSRRTAFGSAPSAASSVVITDHFLHVQKANSFKKCVDNVWSNFCLFKLFSFQRNLYIHITYIHTYL